MAPRFLVFRPHLGQPGTMRTPKPMILPKRPTTRRLLTEAGATQQMLLTGVRSGRLMVVRHGVYLAADQWPDDPAGQHLMRARAEVAAHPHAVISHESAALAWGLPTPGFDPWSDAIPTVTLPPDGHRSRRGPNRHVLSTLDPGEATVGSDGYPVTSPARTAVDLALDLTLPEALVLLDAAARTIVGSMVNDVRRQHYANVRLQAEARALLRHSVVNRRATRLNAAISAANPLRESPGESLTAGHLLVAGLPEPIYQAVIRTPVGRLYPDFYWEHRRLVGECDGAIKYQDSRGYVAEKDREQLLRDMGYAVVRWQVKEIMTKPQAVVERIARALGI